MQQLNLYNPVDIKEYHAKLAQIFKWYISQKQRVSIMNKTTNDVLIYLSKNNLPKNIIAKAATALRFGDSVKFAKFLPSPTECTDCLNNITETINFINTNKLTNK